MKKHLATIFCALVCAFFVNPVDARAPMESSLERDILDEMNVMRADPSKYAERLVKMRPRYQGTLLMRGVGQAPIATTEGVAALDEAIAALQRAPKAGPLTHTGGLARAALDHVEDSGPEGIVGHRGKDGSDSFARISRHGTPMGGTGEVVDYGWDDAENIVIDLLIDDGVMNRGHRNAILRPTYKHAGVACGPHKKFKIMCVVAMAGAFLEGQR
jgi:uncharacterized protein YkwD